MLVDGILLAKEAREKLLERLDVRMEVNLMAVVLIVVYEVVIGAVLLLRILAEIDVFLDLDIDTLGPLSCFGEEFFTSRNVLDVVIILVGSAEICVVWFMVDREE